MASEYPAEFLGLGQELGKILPGYRANLVAMDDGLQVWQTWIDGIASNDEVERRGASPASNEGT
jgi:N-acetylglucosamine-6-phosphate deacetylase